MTPRHVRVGRPVGTTLCRACQYSRLKEALGNIWAKCSERALILPGQDKQAMKDTGGSLGNQDTERVMEMKNHGEAEAVEKSRSQNGM